MTNNVFFYSHKSTTITGFSLKQKSTFLDTFFVLVDTHWAHLNQISQYNILVPVLDTASPI